MTDTDRSDPFARFIEWFDQVKASGIPEPEAMTLATASKEGRPSARVMLLRGFDERGAVFYTNYTSRKSDELGSNPHAALLFYWEKLGWQVRIEGELSRVSEQESDAYWATRPRLNQIGGWASHQSQPLKTNEELDQRVAQFEAKFQGISIPRPPHWGGFRLRPERFEFWIRGDGRLHTREEYRRSGEVWTRRWLNP